MTFLILNATEPGRSPCPFLHSEMNTHFASCCRQHPRPFIRFSACLILALAASVPLCRGDVSETNVFANILRAIPDGNSLGIEDVHTIASDLASITSIQVHLTVAGNFNGDLYGYLSHGSGLTVLLNRSGRTSANPFGYSDCGVDVTFADAAPSDIHNYRQFVTPPTGSPITGIWQPDARFVDPSLVMDYSPRTTFLSEFIGSNPSGSWVLFLADMDPGGTNMLVSWSLQITGTPKTQPPLTWANPADVTYGTALGAAQLNAVASGVPGTFVYNPPAGTVLGAGSGQSLSVTFLPSDTSRYASVTAGVLLNVQPSPLTVTAFNTSRTYGSANPSLSGLVTGLLNGDNINASFDTSATAGSSIGSYAILPAFSDPHGSLVNYTIITNPGVLLLLPLR
jgi:subtilisin-like proprotein convertase family protein